MYINRQSCVIRITEQPCAKRMSNTIIRLFRHRKLSF